MIENTERGPSIWGRNLNTIKSEQFKEIFKTWWENWNDLISIIFSNSGNKKKKMTFLNHRSQSKFE